MFDIKLATKDAGMNKAQSPSPRRLEFTERGEGLKCVGSTEREHLLPVKQSRGNRSEERPDCICC